MAQQAAASARPVEVGDTLSFNSQPHSAKDLFECTVSWETLAIPKPKPASDRYMTFKAKNETAGDSDFLVPVFVQKDYYVKNWGTASGIVQFKVTKEWQYGQQNETGIGRFLVLHDYDKNKPYQDRFIAASFTQLMTIVHGALSATGQAGVADTVDSVVTALIGKFLLSYDPPIVQIGEVLLIPKSAEPQSMTIEWVQNRANHSHEYYYFKNVDNVSQQGKKVDFFIEKDWWDNDASDNHISKVATQNENGDYQYKVDSKFQFGQKDESGSNRWVVYHNKDREIYQHRFPNGKTTLQQIVSILLQTPQVARIAKFNDVTVDRDEIVDFIGRVFGSPLHTFVPDDEF